MKPYLTGIGVLLGLTLIIGGSFVLFRPKPRPKDTAGKIGDTLPPYRGFELRLAPDTSPADIPPAFSDIAALGGNTIELNTIAGQPLAPALRAAVNAAHAAKLHTILIIHSTTRELESSAKLAAWKTDWREKSLSAAKEAASLELDLLVIGYRLDTLQDDDDFCRDWIAAIRRIYSGKLAYAADGSCYGDVPFWDALDTIAIIGNLPLADPANPTQDALDSGWRTHLRTITSLADRYGKSAAILDLGYALDPHPKPGPTFTATNPTYVKDQPTRARYLQTALTQTTGHPLLTTLTLRDYTLTAPTAYSLNHTPLLNEIKFTWLPKLAGTPETRPERQR